MSLWIDVATVVEVLLTDGWHPVLDDSFNLDAYEFHEKEHALLTGGSLKPAVSSTGATWKSTNGRWISCPLEKVLAVKQKKFRA